MTRKLKKPKADSEYPPVQRRLEESIVWRGKELSVKKDQLKTRIMRGREWDVVDRDMRLYAEHALGKPVEEWDLEELARGKVRNKNGKFSQGTGTKMIRPLLDKEIGKRLKQTALREIQSHVHEAIEQLIALMQHSDDDSIRLRAAQLVIEYTVGSPKSIGALQPEQAGVAQILAKALVMPGGAPAHPVIEGSVVSSTSETEEDDDEDL